jgi:hypothetical protein
MARVGRRKASFLIAAIAVVVLTTGTFAANGKFSAIATLIPTGATSSMASLLSKSAPSATAPQYLITFSQYGLGADDIVYVATLQLNTDWVCRNNQPFDPLAANKRTVAVTVSSTASFQTKNGAIRDASFATEAAPLAPAGFPCPPGLTLTLAGTTVSGLFLTNTLTAQTIPVPIVG